MRQEIGRLRRVSRITRATGQPRKLDVASSNADAVPFAGNAPGKIPCGLALLGPFELTGQTGPAARLPKKAQALLAYLAMGPVKRVSREHLATLLWAEHGTEQARRSLRQCLMAVRKTAAGDLVVADGAHIALATHVRIDVTDFQAHARSSRLAELEEADELYRDEFLSGLNIRSEPFEEWLTIERQRFAALRSEVLCQLAMLRAAEGNIEGGIAAAERLVRFDPLREDGHRVLIQLLVAAGRRSAALAQYKRCVEILRRDLGAEPEPETARLGEHIALGRMPPANAAAPERFGLAGAPSGQDSQNEVAQKTPILVLGFSDLSGDPDQNYFAQGIAQDITIALGRIPWLLVIGGSSAASGGEGFAGIQDIAHKLNVRYVLRGSIRRSRLRVRIVVQILDATNGGQLWSHGFDGGLSDIFDIQDRVATQAAAMIAPRLSSLEIDRAERKPTGSLGAYDFYLRAAPKFRKSAAENEQALRLLRRAVDLDRSYATAYALAARCYHFQKVMGWVDPADPALQEGVRLARLAEEYGGDDSEALWMAGLALVFLAGELDHGGRLIEKSLLLNPNSSNAWIASCFAQTFLGNCAAAMEDFVRAQQLNPLDTSQHVRWNAVGNIHFIVGRYDEAADISNKTLSENPTYPPGLRMKIAACGLLRRQDEARDAVRRLLQVNPSASVAMLRAFWEPLLCRSPGALDRYLEGLQLAGLPHA